MREDYFKSIGVARRLRANILSIPSPPLLLPDSLVPEPVSLSLCLTLTAFWQPLSHRSFFTAYLLLSVRRLPCVCKSQGHGVSVRVRWGKKYILSRLWIAQPILQTIAAAAAAATVTA